MLSHVISHGKLILYDALALQKHKTKNFIEAFPHLAEKRSLIVDVSINLNLLRASKNIIKVSTLPLAGVNVRDIFLSEALVISEQAMINLLKKF